MQCDTLRWYGHVLTEDDSEWVSWCKLRGRTNRTWKYEVVEGDMNEEFEVKCWFVVNDD